MYNTYIYICCTQLIIKFVANLYTMFLYMIKGVALSGMSGEAGDSAFVASGAKNVVFTGALHFD